MITKTHFTLATLSAALVLVLAVPVWAHGPGPRGGRRGLAPRPTLPKIIHARGILSQLIFPCQATCTTNAHACYDVASSDALNCISTACPEEVDAAQIACAADRASSECSDAVEALAECADSCLETHATTVTSCRQTLRDCRDACETE